MSKDGVHGRAGLKDVSGVLFWLRLHDARETEVYWKCIGWSHWL
jgi:hypothetical protein